MRHESEDEREGRLPQVHFAKHSLSERPKRRGHGGESEALLAVLFQKEKSLWNFDISRIQEVKTQASCAIKITHTRFNPTRKGASHESENEREGRPALTLVVIIGR